MINNIAENIIRGKDISLEEAEYLIECDLDILCENADKLKNYFCGNNINLCSIISGKSGNCSEDCKFCAQSAHYKTSSDCHGFLDSDVILQDCINHYKKGVHRYSIVTSGRLLNSVDFEKSVEAYRKIHNNCKIGLCASHGLLSYEQFKRLKESGVTRYHCNIETSKEYFPKICSTHTFQDKTDTINSAKKAGLEICSGGIIGLGESFKDRISMAFTLKELQVDSIPINVLTPIKNTPFENNKLLDEYEILRTVAIFRFINPKADIRIAAGRNRLSDNGIKAFYSGANAAITGDYLTTTGSTIAEDMKMFKTNNFNI